VWCSLQACTGSVARRCGVATGGGSERRLRFILRRASNTAMLGDAGHTESPAGTGIRDGEYGPYPGIGYQDRARHRLDARFHRLRDAVVGRARVEHTGGAGDGDAARRTTHRRAGCGVLDVECWTRACWTRARWRISSVLRGGPFEDITVVCHIDAVYCAGQQVMTSSGAARAATNRGGNRT
jgi:hypothetical protein